jgi:DNA modification methylase
MRPIHIEQGDALDLMGALPDGSVACVVTDPPYNSQDKWRAIGTTTRLGGGSMQDEADDLDRFIDGMIAEGQ